MPETTPLSPNRLVQADLFTASYRISGRVPVTITGLTSMLNNPNTSLLSVEDVYLSRIHQAGNIAGYHAAAQMVKHTLLAVLLPRRDDLGVRPSVARGGYTQTVPNRVLITCGTLEVHGTLEGTGKPNFAGLMAEGAHGFFPLYNVTLNPVLYPDTQLRGEACLINRAWIDLFTALEEK